MIQTHWISEVTEYPPHKQHPLIWSSWQPTAHAWDHVLRQSEIFHNVVEHRNETLHPHRVPMIHSRPSHPSLSVHRRLHQVPHIQLGCIRFPDTQGTPMYFDDHPTCPQDTIPSSKQASIDLPIVSSQPIALLLPMSPHRRLVSSCNTEPGSIVSDIVSQGSALAVSRPSRTPCIKLLN